MNNQEEYEALIDTGTPLTPDDVPEEFRIDEEGE